MDPEPQRQPDATPNVASGVRTFASLTLVSRVAGLARDLVTVRLFGDSAIGSAFAAAFAVPNLFRRLFGEGALSAAFIPEYASLIRDRTERSGSDRANPDAKADADTSDRFASLLLALLTLLLSALLVVSELALLAVLLAFEHDEQRAFSIRLVMLMLPFMPVVCIAAALGGLLHVHGKFAPSAGAPIVLNACMIAAALWHFVSGSTVEASAERIGIAAIIAGVLQVAWALFALRGRVRWTAGYAQAVASVRSVMRKFVPALIGLGTLQLNALLDTVIAMWPLWVGPTMLGAALTLDDSSNAVLSYTQRLYQFPLGVFGIAVATAAFPALARLAPDRSAFAKALRGAGALSLFIGLPASIGLALVGNDLTALMFGTHGGEHGFSQTGLDRSSAVLLAYACGVWAYSLNQVLTRAFYAQGDTTTPMRVSLAMVALNIALNLTLIWPLKEAGLAWSTALTAGVQTLTLSWLVQTRLTGERPVPLAAGIRVIGNASVMGVVVWLVGTLLPSGDGLASLCIRVGVMATTGIVTYTALAALTKSPELKLLTRRTRERTP